MKNLRTARWPHEIMWVDFPVSANPLRQARERSVGRTPWSVGNSVRSNWRGEDVEFQFFSWQTKAIDFLKLIYIHPLPMVEPFCGKTKWGNTSVLKVMAILMWWAHLGNQRFDVNVEICSQRLIHCLDYTTEKINMTLENPYMFNRKYMFTWWIFKPVMLVFWGSSK